MASASRRAMLTTSMGIAKSVDRRQAVRDEETFDRQCPEALISRLDEHTVRRRYPERWPRTLFAYCLCCRTDRAAGGDHVVDQYWCAAPDVTDDLVDADGAAREASLPHDNGRSAEERGVVLGELHRAQIGSDDDGIKWEVGSERQTRAAEPRSPLRRVLGRELPSQECGGRRPAPGLPERHR